MSILEPLTASKYTFKDLLNFASEIDHQNSSNFMSRLDIRSLFSNVPLAKTIEICALFRVLKEVNLKFFHLYQQKSHV